MTQAGMGPLIRQLLRQGKRTCRRNSYPWTCPNLLRCGRRRARGWVPLRRRRYRLGFRSATIQVSGSQSSNLKSSIGEEHLNMFSKCALGLSLMHLNLSIHRVLSIMQRRVISSHLWKKTTRAWTALSSTQWIRYAQAKSCCSIMDWNIGSSSALTPWMTRGHGSCRFFASGAASPWHCGQCPWAGSLRSLWSGHWTRSCCPAMISSQMRCRPFWPFTCWRSSVQFLKDTSDGDFQWRAFSFHWA
mmetsp:Transcript_23897/g.43779  ORF Transcript_23897/g.43779 Transcript_23897/m.43779 type:complete len:245 (-) Transcript_23897:53-787(-)